MEGSCQCRSIKFTTPTPNPKSLYVCHCRECRAQSSSAFGISAIFQHFKLELEVMKGRENIKSWTRSTDAGNILRCYFCALCGSRLLHETVDEKGVAVPGRNVSVKGGCLVDIGEGHLDLSKAIHIWTKRAIVPIPQGVEWYEDDGPV